MRSSKIALHACLRRVHAHSGTYFPASHSLRFTHALLLSSLFSSLCKCGLQLHLHYNKVDRILEKNREWSIEKNTQRHDLFGVLELLDRGSRTVPVCALKLFHLDRIHVLPLGRNAQSIEGVAFCDAREMSQ